MADKTRVISANDMHVLTTACLNAATEIHTAMCLFDDEHAAQNYLNGALHSALTGVEICRQIHVSKKVRIATADPGSELANGKL